MHHLSFKNYRIAFSRQFRVALSIVALLFLGANTAHGQSGAVPCPPNLDFSYGNFTNWYCYTGTASPGSYCGSTGKPCFAGPTLSGPIGPTPGPARHEIMTGTGTDPYGGFSVTAPGGGLFSLRLGNNQTGYGAERVRYYVHVPVGFNNYSFRFSYAAVLDNGGQHDSTEQPTYTVIGYDSATGLGLPCATQSFTISGSTPGFTPSPINSSVWYLPWTTGTLNLSGQGGKTIIVEVTTWDCTQGGHFGYGYFDILSCGQFQAAVTFCNLSTGVITLQAPPGYANYQWFTGPTISGGSRFYSGSAFTINIAPPGTPTYYYCVLTPFGSNGCPDTIRTRTVSNFSFNVSPDSVCNSLGNPITLTEAATGGLGGFIYSWIADPTLTPGVPTLTGSTAVVRPLGTGFYVGIATDSIGCVRYDTVRVQNPDFHLNLGPDFTTCLGTPRTILPTLTPSSPGYVFQWSPGTNLSNATILNPTFTPSVLGTMTYVLRVDSGICATADTITIRTLPNYFSVTDTALCEGELFNFTVVGTDSFKYYWTPTSQIQTSLPSRVPTLLSDTTRTYTITAKYPGCPDVVRQVTATVEPVPRVDIGPDSIDKCLYTPLYLTAHVLPAWFTKYTYQWRANTDIDDVTSPIISFTGRADTTLRVTVRTPLGCRSRDSIRVHVYAGSFGTVTPSDTSVCPRNEVILQAGGGVSYLWRPSIYLSDSTKSTITAHPFTNVDYTLYVKDKNGCVDTLPVSLKVFSEALVSLPDSAILYPGESYRLEPGGNALYFNWFPTVGLNNPGVSNPIATPSVNTRYYVTGTTEAGCKTTDSIYVLVHEESVLNMPNAFTPGSAPNAEFKVSRLGIASLKVFRIYNRWGTKVFETTDINKGWNGQFNGEPQPMGVYVYTVEATTNTGKAFTKNGNVTLIR